MLLALCMLMARSTVASSLPVGDGAIDAELIRQLLVTTSSAGSELVTLAGAVMVTIH